MTDYYKRCSRCDQWQPREEYRPSRTDRDGLSAWCKSCFREYQREWRYRNRGRLTFKRRLKQRTVDGFIKAKAAYHLRRAKKRGVECTVTEDELKELLLESNGFCYYCGSSFQYHELTIDHIIPLSKNGPHSKDNIVFACQNCNNIKASGERPKRFKPRSKRKVVKIKRPS